MKSLLASVCLLLPVLGAAPSAVNLPPVTVYSPRVANQTPAGTFAMPVSALRYEPRVDLHARNLAEGQADVTLRGGIFENTAFQVGAVSLVDPQTGHYFAEIPVAPAMLGAPEVRTGSALALGPTNATAGAVSYGWREIRTAGAAAVAAGQHAMRRADLYQGFAGLGGAAGGIGVDIALAHSESKGAVAFGEHEFDRANARLQHRRGAGQSDLAIGYQEKRFGWPNMYTPFNSNETENLQTLLLAANHRADLGGGQFFEAGLFHRRNKDDYAFNRFAPVGPVHPFQHTTWVDGAGVSARQEVAGLAVNVRGELFRDRLQSTSLTFGRYRSRVVRKAVVAPEKSWSHADGGRTTVLAGVGYDDTSHDRGAFSPVVELSRELRAARLQRIHVSYTKTTQMPTYTALNSSAAAGLFRGNPNLGRQRSHAIEAGVVGSFAGWESQAAVFWRRDDALVDWTFRRGVTARTANAVDIDVSGIEFVLRRTWRACEVVIGYTALTKDADYRGAAVDASFYALNYARHRLTAAFTARLGSGFELRIDNVARIQAENALRVIGGDEGLTTSVGLAYRPGAFPQGELFVAVDNAWDSDFQDVPAVPATPRQFSGGINYRW